MQQTLILVLGAPGAGKSTFAKQLAPKIGAIRISADSIRKNMFDNPREHMTSNDDRRVAKIQNYITYEILSAGHSLIYDALTESYQKRKELYDLAASLHVGCILVNVVLSEDLVINRLKPPVLTEEFTADYKELLTEFNTTFEPPRNSEKTVIIQGDSPFEDQLSLFLGDLS